jgi:hypothetical protein
MYDPRKQSERISLGKLVVVSYRCIDRDLSHKGFANLSNLVDAQQRRDVDDTEAVKFVGK